MPEKAANTAATAVTDEETVGLRPPRFGLRRLFWIVSFFCALFGAMPWLGWTWSLVLVWILLMAAAHVAGNVVGTTLRDSSAQALNRSSSDAAAADGPLSIGVSRFRTATPPQIKGNRLHGSEPVHRAVPWWCALGAIGGAAAGGTLLTVTQWDEISALGILLGATSFAVLGALFTFLATACWEVTRQAWREAANEE